MTPHNFLISFKKLDRIVTYREWEAQQMAGRPAKTCVALAENTKPMEDINEGKKFSFESKKAQLFQHLNFFWVKFFLHDVLTDALLMYYKNNFLSTME